MTGEQQDEHQGILRQCERFLSGHGLQTVRQTLEELVAEVGPERVASSAG